MKILQAGCDDGMNMISHGQAASNSYSKNFKRGRRTRDTRNGRRNGRREFSLFIDKNDFNSFIAVKSC